MKVEKSRPAPANASPPENDDETVYRSLYEGCANDALEAHDAARVWLLLGEHHLTRDLAAGPFARNRAVEAFEHAIAAAPDSPAGDLSKLRLGLTYQAQGRHEAAAKTLLAWLAVPGRTRGEAATAVSPAASALTFVDFLGPRKSDPFVLREDVLDTEPNPTLAQRKMHVGIDRLLDPHLVAPEAPFTLELFVAAARYYRALSQIDNQLEALAGALHLFPLDRDAPLLLQALFETASRRTLFTRPGTREHADNLLAEADSWKRVDEVAPGSPWADKNRGENGAIAVRDSLLARRADIVPSLLVAAAVELLDLAAADRTTAETLLARADAAAARAQTMSPEALGALASAIRLTIRARRGEHVPEADWRTLHASAAGMPADTRAKIDHVRTLARESRRSRGAASQRTARRTCSHRAAGPDPSAGFT